MGKRKFRENRTKFIDMDEDVLFYVLCLSRYLDHDVMPIKIGITQNIERRMANLQSANPDKIRIMFLAKSRRKVIEDMERFFKHVLLWPFASGGGGEWFVLDRLRISHVLSVAFYEIEKMGGHVPSPMLEVSCYPQLLDFFEGVFKDDEVGA